MAQMEYPIVCNVNINISAEDTSWKEYANPGESARECIERNRSDSHAIIKQLVQEKVVNSNLRVELSAAYQKLDENFNATRDLSAFYSEKSKELINSKHELAAANEVITRQRNQIFKLGKYLHGSCV